MSAETGNAEEAARRIAFCLRKGRDHLNLGGLGLERLPPEFDRLDGLRYLDLTDNVLARLPPALCGFIDLRWLGLNGNRLEELPAGFGRLKRLERLYLRNNRLQGLPDRFGDLTGLIELDLHGNRIANLPRSFLGLLARPEGAEALYYDLADNPGEVALVAQEGAATLRRYLEGLARESTLVREGKLLFVGDGGGGKSTLLNALQGGKFVPGRSTTHGFKLEPLDLPTGSGSVRLNSWDFSGQPQVRETHQIFFTEPGIYLVVWNARSASPAASSTLIDWLWLIRHRTRGHARVLIVATNTRDVRSEVRDAHEIRQLFGGPEGMLVEPGFLSVECNEGPDGTGQVNIDKLRGILSRIVETEAVFCQEVRAEWRAAQQKLAELRDDRKFLPWESFVAFCTGEGIAPEEIKTFARLEHQVGRLVWIERGLLAHTVILSPEWLSKALGFVFQARIAPERPNGVPAGATGLFPQKRVEDIWRDPHALDELGCSEPSLPGDLFPTFHAFMEEFDLSHPIRPPTDRPELGLQRLVPQHLGAEPPPAWGHLWPPAAPAANLRRRVDLLGYDGKPLNDWLRRSFFSRLLVRLYPHTRGREIPEQAAHWENGFRLEEIYLGEARLQRRGHQIFFEAHGAKPDAVWWQVREAMGQLVLDLAVTVDLTVILRYYVGCPAICTRPEESRAYFDEELVKRWHAEKRSYRDCVPDCDRSLDVREMFEGIRADSCHHEMLEAIRDVGAKTERVGSKVDRVESRVEGVESKVDGVQADTAVIRDYAEALWTSVQPVVDRFDDLFRRVAQLADLGQASRDDIAAARQLAGETKAAIDGALRQLDDPARRGPRLFSIAPATPEFWTDRGGLFERSYVLHLHCERTLYPVSWLRGTAHLGSFPLRVDREWWRRTAPYLKGISRVLAVLPAAASLAGIHEPAAAIQREAAQKLAQDMEKLLEAAGADSFAAPGTHIDSSAKARLAEGGTLRWLHEFLCTQKRTSDLLNTDLGLERVEDKSEKAGDRPRYLWVHSSQARYYGTPS